MKRHRSGSPDKDVSDNILNSRPITSLPFHPNSFLIPTQIAAPLILPYDTTVPSETIVFSQNDVNNSNDDEFFGSEMWKLEDPDLKYVKFNKPYLYQGKLNTSDAIPNEWHEKYPILQNISPVQKSDYLKLNFNSETPELITSLNNKDSSLVDKVVDMFDLDYKIESNKTPDIPKYKFFGDEKKPEFKYDTKVTQSVLLSHVKNEFSQLVETINRIDQLDDYEDDTDLFNEYEYIGLTRKNILRAEILTSMKSKLNDLVRTNVYESVDQSIYHVLFDHCIEIVKEALLLDWENLQNSADDRIIAECRNFAASVMIASSIVILLYTNHYTEKLIQNQKGLTCVMDFISIIGNLVKKLYIQEHFTELPDFSIPFVKHFSTLLVTLKTDFPKLVIDESLLTRLEYISFDIVFTEIIFSKERSNLNEALEGLRADFANLLISIYMKYQDQRLFLFNEIMENLNTLNPLKSKAKTYLLDNGVSVQLVSYLILSFIQCHNQYGDNFEFSKWEFLNIDHKTKAKSVQFNEMNDYYWNSIEHQSKSMEAAVNNFITSFLQKIISTYSPNVKKIVENIFADMFNMMELLEFPSCPIILDRFVTIGLQIYHSAEISNIGAHGLIFELIGLTASKILNIKQYNDMHVFRLLNMDRQSFKAMSDNYLVLLKYLKFSCLYDYADRSFKFLSLVFLKNLKKWERETDLIIKSEKNRIIGETLKSKRLLLKEIKATIVEVMEMPYQDKAYINCESPTDAEIATIYKEVLLFSDLIQRYDDILAHILNSLKNPKIKGRTLAIKNLALLINKNPELLQDKSLRIVIKQRLTESSATVIDASLDLVVKILETNPEFVTEYYKIIAQRADDVSTNVKKKSIHLIKLMYPSTNNIHIKVRLCQALLSQLDDENDKIVYLASFTLCELLFLNLNNNANIQKQSMDVVAARTISDETISVLCGLVTSGTNTWDQFERFFNEKVIYQSAFNKPVRHELKLSLNHLVEVMLALMTDSGLNAENNQKLFNRVESKMAVLSTFVKYDQTLISQHQLISIQPYIINDYKSGGSCFYALQILNFALDHFKTLNKSFVESCKSSLMERLTKFNSKELDQAIQCVWKLFCIDGNTMAVSKACISSLKLLLKQITQLQSSDETFKLDPSVPRLLYLIGTFGEYCDFEHDRRMFLDAKLGLRSGEPISVFLLKYILKFCEFSINKPVRKVAIKNALNICISYPKLFFSTPVMALIDSSFKKKDVAIINIIVGSFLKFLENEEIKMIKKNGLEIKRSGSVKLDIAIFHGYSLEYINDGICSTLVQKYLNDILKTCLDNDIDNSLNSINFLKMVVKFGFSNPKTCFPIIAALECSKLRYVKHLALELHKFLFDKFESLIESTYSEAIKTVVVYTSNIYNPYEMEKCCFFLNSFYRIVKERKSTQRLEKFTNAILRAVGNVSMYKFGKMDTADLKTVQNQIIFLAININEVEYSSNFEILTIINTIEKVILSEENIFGDQFNLLMDMFDDGDDTDEKFKYIVMARILLCLNSLVKCMITNYSISPDLLLKFQESSDKKSFRTAATRSQSNKFFAGEIKDLLTKNKTNQLTLLHNKLLEFNKK